jgi:hypothetical protein
MAWNFNGKTGAKGETNKPKFVLVGRIARSAAANGRAGFVAGFCPKPATFRKISALKSKRFVSL